MAEMSVDHLIVENIRCFAGPERADIAPLTLLIGENSTGKSTFLALCRIAWDIAFGLEPPNFNEEPFLMGAYNQIAHDSGSPGGRAASFTVGWQTPLTKHHPRTLGAAKGDHISYTAEFGQKGAQPEIVEKSIQCGPYRLTLDYRKSLEGFLMEFETPQRTYHVAPSERVEVINPTRELFFAWPFIGQLMTHSFWASGGPLNVGGSFPPVPDFEVFQALLRDTAKPQRLRPYASAPVRTKPERTYNPIDAKPKPEGGHVPMVLTKLHFEKGKDWTTLKQQLEKFGSAAGLFRSLGIRRLGESESDPFQIQVKISGPASNLIDVGYGVSQVLPILVDAIQGPEGSTYLLQQPEVHLHPRAQAELATFLGTLAARQRKRFVVETHSDFMIDRIRMDVRDKKIGCEDVSIIYFDRIGLDVRVHNINIDKYGNLVNVPEGYRQFFLDEEKRFLGI
jgi:hypothetical protein